MRFIQVGLGGHGRGWVDVLTSDDRASLVAIADVDGKAVEEARGKTGLRKGQCFSDFRAALESVEADAVLNVTPPSVHRDVALEALRNGMHVLTEKPMADNMAHATEMVRAAEGAGRTLMVSQNYRFQPWVKTVSGLLESDQYGPPESIAVNFAKPRHFGGFRDVMDDPLVTDMSIHHFDLMRAVTGLDPLSVYATTWNPGWSWFRGDACCRAVFAFEGGLNVCYDASWVSRLRETTWNGSWAIECPGAAIELVEDRVQVVPAECPDKASEIELRQMPCEGLAFALYEFQRAVEEGREPEASGRDNLKSLAMVFAVLESSRTGKPTKIRP